MTALDLPPYRPNFNPIERMFGKVKAELRALAADTAETLRTAVASDTPSDGIGWFTACGYRFGGGASQ